MTAMSSLCMCTATNFSSSLWFRPKRKSGIGHLDAVINTGGRENVEFEHFEISIPVNRLVMHVKVSIWITSPIANVTFVKFEQIFYACLSQ